MAPQLDVMFCCMDLACSPLLQYKASAGQVYCWSERRRLPFVQYRQAYFRSGNQLLK